MLTVVEHQAAVCGAGRDARRQRFARLLATPMRSDGFRYSKRSVTSASSQNHRHPRPHQRSIGCHLRLRVGSCRRRRPRSTSRCGPRSASRTLRSRPTKLVNRPEACPSGDAEASAGAERAATSWNTYSARPRPRSDALPAPGARHPQEAHLTNSSVASEQRSAHRAPRHQALLIYWDRKCPSRNSATPVWMPIRTQGSPTPARHPTSTDFRSPHRRRHLPSRTPHECRHPSPSPVDHHSRRPLHAG